MLCRVLPGATDAPPYAPGGNEHAQAVLELKTEVDAVKGTANAIWGLSSNVNGLIDGMRSVNNGVRSTISFLTSTFRVVSNVLNGAGMEWQDGYLRIYATTVQMILGASFGADNDLVFYYGPNVGAAQARKNNATIWFDKLGGAYFGGTLSAGTLKNGAKSTQVSAAASVETGPFGTNGRPKSVVCSFDYDNSGITQQNMSGHQLSARLILERQRGTHGAWEQVHAVNLTGAAESEYEPGMPWLTSMRIGGGFTYTDNSPGTDGFNYRLRIANAHGWPYWIGQGNQARLGTQSLSVLSLEEP
ncbi:hypothetical protein CO615_02315 [Lysobacteraceae bacterium NML75-0749]|nr:hypothetical protein CO615_02315 [Xanthomonadaceae bacterium NML75-0749]